MLFNPSSVSWLGNSDRKCFCNANAKAGIAFLKNARCSLSLTGSIAAILIDRLRELFTNAPQSLRPSHHLSYAVLVRKTSRREITNPSMPCIIGMFFTWLVSASLKYSISRNAMRKEYRQMPMIRGNSFLNVSAL